MNLNSTGKRNSLPRPYIKPYFPNLFRGYHSSCIAPAPPRTKRHAHAQSLPAHMYTHIRPRSLSLPLPRSLPPHLSLRLREQTLFRSAFISVQGSLRPSLPPSLPPFLPSFLPPFLPHAVQRLSLRIHEPAPRLKKPACAVSSPPLSG